MYREPTGRAIIVTVIERVIEGEEKEREMSRDGEKERRERHEKREAQEERGERGSDYLQNAPVCTFKTLPSVCDTGVLSVHTGAF